MRAVSLATATLVAAYALAICYSGLSVLVRHLP